MDNQNLDYYVKILSLGVFIFLLCNYIFNIGYFTLPGIEYISLLEIRDYYEGTAPLITMVFGILLSFFNFIPFSGELKNIPRCFQHSIRCFFSLPLKFIICKLMNIFRLLKCKNNYSLKKTYLYVKKEIDDAQTEFKEYRKLFTKDLLSFIYPICTLFAPICFLYILVYKYDHLLFYSIATVYIIYSLLFLYFKRLKKLNFTISIIIISIYLLGIWVYLKDYQRLDSYAIIDNKKQHLIRTLSKGIIIKNENENISFYKWDSVEKIIKSKSEVNNAK